MSKSLAVLLYILCICCNTRNESQVLPSQNLFYQADSLTTIGDIVLPDGYKRVSAAKGSFAEWLRTIHLKRDNHVYLYNGRLKQNQTAQFAVLNISVGHKDLQQCADAVMRLRAEYLFSQKRFSEIVFIDNNEKSLPWKGGDNRTAFNDYLDNVFSWCNSASLEKQLKSVNNFNEIQPGDVLIKGGFPGHAMIVTDIAITKEGKKIFMLAQSYMPAQDIHIVRNPMDERLSPWYEVNNNNKIETPEYLFYRNQLRRW